jgi:WD40-like Beta Propeller Repeat
MGAGSISTSRAAVALAVVVVALLSLSGSAEAAFPGQNGKIAYNIYTGSPPGPPLGHLWTVNPDGTDATTIAEGSWPSWSPDGQKIAYMATDGIRVANPDGSASQLAIASAFYPAWSPDGTKLAYTRRLADGSDELYVANADGTGETRVTFNAITDSHPSWSPDGTRIAFDSVRDGRADVFVINTDGTGETRLTSLGLNYYPDWSPDGARIAWMSTREDGNGDIWTMKPDGTDPVKVAGAGGPEHQVAWAPDGTKLAYWRSGAIWIVNSDGTGAHEIRRPSTNNGVSWQPLPVGYPRPKGASPMRVSLVPAVLGCEAPNRMHGPPLVHPACAPPVPASENLTAGVGDGSLAFAKSIGYMRLFVVAGNPGPPDDSDVLLRASITNVMNASDLSEYTGELRAVVGLRITDRDNTPHPGGPGPGTVQDTELAFTVPCVGTPDTGVASTCVVDTSADAVVPGMAAEGTRAVWGLGQVSMSDGGADGDAETLGDNQRFSVQGVFVP